MPRDGSGNYSLPSGTAVTGGTTILASVWNNFTSDVASVLDAAQPITKGGTGAATVGAAQTALDIPARTGAATVTGGWTFSGSATFTGATVVPTPTDATHAVRKSYVDDNFGPKNVYSLKVTLRGSSGPELTAQTNGTWVTGVAEGGAGGGKLRVTVDSGVVDATNLVLSAQMKVGGFDKTLVPLVTSVSSTLIEVTLRDGWTNSDTESVNDAALSGDEIHIIGIEHA